MSEQAGPSEEFKCGYTAGYDQAQFDLTQGSDQRTLEDDFAMAALVNCSDHIGNPKDMAEAAYEIARAMLTAREGK